MEIWKTKFHEISRSKPYFIADVGSNHEGDIDRALLLCDLVRDSGGHAVKFQHFKAENIVSDYGFKKLDNKLSHQSNWSETVFDTYKKYEYNREWDNCLMEHCDKIGLDYLTTPYDIAAANSIVNKVDLIKIGSGDSSWLQFIEYLASFKKPLLLATGATSMEEVRSAASIIQRSGCPFALLQCNTNYTGNEENFEYVNLNVLKSYQSEFPGCLYGLSDHTPGYSTTLGAIALGASIIEKHFTDDKSRQGPDHHFAMDPSDWKNMIKESNRLVAALGDGVKRIEENEQDSSIVQRRSVCASQNLGEGDVIDAQKVEMLRPYPAGSFSPAEVSKLIGKKLNRSIPKGAPILGEYINDL